MKYDLQLEREPTQTARADGEISACPNGCDAAGDAVLHEFGCYGVCRCARCALVVNSGSMTVVLRKLRAVQS